MAHRVLAGTAMGDYIRAYDWSTTPLGPLEAWSDTVVQTLNTMLYCRFPVLLVWGPDMCSVYNDAFMEVLGVRHPICGLPGKTAGGCCGGWGGVEH